MKEFDYDSGGRYGLSITPDIDVEGRPSESIEVQLRSFDLPIVHLPRADVLRLRDWLTDWLFQSQWIGIDTPPPPDGVEVIVFAPDQKPCVFTAARDDDGRRTG